MFVGWIQANVDNDREKQTSKNVLLLTRNIETNNKLLLSFLWQCQKQNSNRRSYHYESRGIQLCCRGTTKLFGTALLYYNYSCISYIVFVKTLLVKKHIIFRLVGLVIKKQ
jgi:hypothetical protein